MVLILANVALLPVLVVDLPTVPPAGAVGAILAAAFAELAGPRLLQRVGARRAGWTVPGMLTGLVWSGQLAGLAVADALGWPVYLWAGIVVVSALLAAAIGFTSTAADFPQRHAAT
jgi:hypothetical protein